MRLELDARARRLLRRLPVVNVYSIAELVLLAGLAIQAARLVWVIVTPISPVGDWRPVQATLPLDPAAVLRTTDPFFRLDAAQGPAVVTALQLQLFGTRIDEASGRGSAIIAAPDGEQQSYAVGDAIMPGVTLKSVAFDHVVIDRGGRSENLFLDQSDAATPTAVPADTASPSPTPSASAAQAPVEGNAVTMAQVRSDIGFIPRISAGRISGLTVHAQGFGEAFRKAGLKNDDVITSIGGKPVTGPSDLDRVAKDYVAGGKLPIIVERGSQTLPLTITIAAS